MGRRTGEAGGRGTQSDIGGAGEREFGGGSA